MSDDDKTMNKPRLTKRPSISVSRKTYERLRDAYPTGSLAALVDNLIASALNDPAACARLLALCQQQPEVLS